MRTHLYRIVVSGDLGDLGQEAFGDFRIESDGTNTVLIGDLDQAALHGALNRLLALSFELLALTRLSDAPAERKRSA